MIQNANRQIRLKQRPDGIARPDNFEQAVEPLRQPEDGELLVGAFISRSTRLCRSGSMRIRAMYRP